LQCDKSAHRVTRCMKSDEQPENGELQSQQIRKSSVQAGSASRKQLPEYSEWWLTNLANELLHQVGHRTTNLAPRWYGSAEMPDASAVTEGTQILLLGSRSSWNLEKL
jgi:hypothetical protein